MKIKGWKICGANVEYIVIPRINAPEGRIVFKAEAVLDMSPFNDMVPLPQPKMRMLPGGLRELDPDDKFFDRASKDYADKRFNYIIIQSLKATEGLEWETVKYTDPNTWANYEQELRDAGFTFNEINLITAGVMSANALNQVKLDEARESFLALLAAAQVALSSRTDAQLNSSSGEHVNGSVSGHQESEKVLTNAT